VDTLVGTYCSNFKKMYPVERVAELHHVLQDFSYVVVIQKDFKSEVSDGQEIVLGIIDQGKLEKIPFYYPNRVFNIWNF